MCCTCTEVSHVLSWAKQKINPLLIDEVERCPTVRPVGRCVWGPNTVPSSGSTRRETPAETATGVSSGVD
jgi:hypothetical protein